MTLPFIFWLNLTLKEMEDKTSIFVMCLQWATLLTLFSQEKNQSTSRTLLFQFLILEERTAESRANIWNKWQKSEY